MLNSIHELISEPLRDGEVAGGHLAVMHKAIDKWAKSYEISENAFFEYLRASQMYFLCPREFVLNYWNPINSKIGFDWQSNLVMGIGTSLHSMVQNEIFAPMGILRGNWECPLSRTIKKSCDYPGKPYRYSEVEVRHKRLRIQGHIDAVFEVKKVNKLLGISLPDNEEEVLGEIKTVGGKVFDRVNCSNDIPPYYKMQACIYQKLYGVSRTIFWYICRDDLRTKMFVYNYEPGWWNEAARKARIIWEAIRDETLPESLMACVTPSDRRASRCSHKMPCWSYFLKSKELFKEWVARKKEEQPNRKWLDLTNVDFSP